MFAVPRSGDVEEKCVRRWLSIRLPVYFSYDLSSCCSRQEFAQEAQEFILCPGNINDCRVLFLHNTGDVPSNACRVHAVLLVMLHLTDAPGDAPAVFLIAENAFLTCFCKTGTDVPQFYDGDMDAVHRPMPELPPVTMTTLLSSPAMIFLLKRLIWFEYTASQGGCLYG